MGKTLESVLKTTYRQKRGPKALAFSKYKADVEAGFEKLLERNPAEEKVQAYFERNPCLVPGAWTPGSKSGHNPLHCALITQPRLPGFHSRQPDFMWMATHSGTWFPTLIEIESPTKKIFTKSGLPSAHFTEARNQLAQWRTWFNTPSNVQQFIDSYGVPLDFRRFRTMQVHMILIYGRRAEFKGNPELSQQRASLLPGNDEELISFDRISADSDLRDAMTIKALGCGRYEVVALPPVFSTDPFLADRLLYIHGFEEALDKTDGIPLKRKEFLKERIAYWREWASTPGSRVVGKSYRE